MSQDQTAPLQAPSPTLGQLWPRALTWALTVTALLCGGLFALAALQGLLKGSWDVRSTLLELAQVALGLLALLFAARLVWLSRPLMDRAFAWTGFLATFFGLAVLALLFLQLAHDAVQWFIVTPRLIELRNQELRHLADKLEDPQQFIAEQLAQVRQEMHIELKQAANEAEKKAIRELYEEKLLPLKRQDFEQTVREIRVEVQKGLRENPTAWNVLGHYLSAGTSHRPQEAGIFPALMGSLWIALITILFAVPVGVGAALYLEEYRTAGWLGRVIQVNINNLAGVPSVVYGILGAFVFVELIFKPLAHWNSAIAARNLLGGGLTLGLLTLPVIIVAAQEAIRAVPKSIREGAYALGATRWQVTWHQVLPMARPGILTGSILGISRAIGEAAPLVLFGALLFVNQTPTLFSRFTILPLQIFDWAGRPPVALDHQPVDIWRYNAAMASIVLLVMLLALNAVAIYLRNRTQRQAHG